MVDEHDEDLAVPRAQPNGAVTDLDDAVRQAEATDAEHVVRRGADRRPELAGCGHRRRPACLDGQPGKFGLGHPGGGPDHPERLRGCDVLAAGDVDEPEDLVGGWVVDGYRGATPRLDEPVEVLGGMDLHRGVEMKGGARCVRAGMVLVPDRALDEVDPLHPPEHRRADRTPTTASPRRRRPP